MDPVHTHNSAYFNILRPCLWFAVGDKVLTDKFREYYTAKAIESMKKFGFIEIIME